MNQSTKEWQNIVFGDECKLNLLIDGRAYVWRQSGTHFNPESRIWKFELIFHAPLIIIAQIVCTRLESHWLPFGIRRDKVEPGY